MSNPYRGRPTRARVETTTGYGLQNQNPWNSMSGQVPPNVPSSGNVFHNQATGVNQPKSSTDSWDWGTDNGNNGNNDSWNWSIDQQPEPHYSSPPQQQQSQQQQNQFIPYQKQTPPVQENYYKSLNGNNRTLTNQHSTSGRTTPRTNLSRESTPNHGDNYFSYQNYTFNQQLPPAQRPSSTKSNSSLSEQQSQWPNDQQFSYSPQSLPPQTQLSQPPVGNYNWNERQSVSLQNWQDQPKNSGYWQETGTSDSGGGNQWTQSQNQISSPQSPTLQNVHSPLIHQQPVQQQTPHHLQQQGPQIHQQSPQIQSPQQSLQTPAQSNQIPAQGFHQQNSSAQSQQIPDYSPSQNWHDQRAGWSNNTPLNQWQNQNSEAVQPNQWPKSENNSQQWQQEIAQNEPPQPTNSSSSSSSWMQQTDIKENSLDNSESNRISASEWQTIRPAAHFASSNTSTTSGSTANISNITEQTEERKKITPATSSTSLNDSTGLSSGPSKTKTTFSAQDSLQDQENIELDWNADSEWTSELTTGLSQMNINKNSTKIQSSDVDNSSIIANLPEVETENAIKETQQVEGETYDQWYNQSTSIAQDNWYPNDRIRNTQKWPTEQNVENYENIQQSSDFMNLEVVAPEMQVKDIYGSRESINQETLDNDPKIAESNSRDFKQEVNNIEVPSLINQPEQAPDNYEFASNDRNTFLETGELTDSHEEHEPTPPSQDDENDEVPNDIPFLREVPGQSSVDPRRNDPTGQEQYGQARIIDPRRNDPSGQEQTQTRNVDRSERRDVPPGQERIVPLLQRVDSDIMERRNDPSGRERSIPPPPPPQQSRNDPSGEEQSLQIPQAPLESSESREIPGRGNEIEEAIQQSDSDLRQILGGASPNESSQTIDDRSRVITGSQEVMSSAPLAIMQESVSESRNKREEAVGASLEGKGPNRSQNRRDSFEDGDDEQSTNSRDESRERLREGSTEHKRFDSNRPYYDREREYDDDYYYERRRGDYDRPYNSREDLDRRDGSFRDEDRRHASRDDLDRHGREESDRRMRPKGDTEERDSRRRIEDHRRERDDLRRRDRQGRDYEPRYTRGERDFSDRRRDDRRPRFDSSRKFDDYDPRDAYRRDYYDDPYNRTSRPSSRSSYNDRDREYYMRSRDPYYSYNGYGAGYDYGSNYNNNYYLYLENLRRTNPTAYMEWYNKYYASQRQPQHPPSISTNYPEDRASVHSGRSSCDDRTTSEKRNLGEITTLDDSVIATSRMTPTKFSTAHVKGSFSIGCLVHVHPAYPADGERAKLDIFRIDNLLQNDPVARELRTYPGPLIKQVGVTHKKTIIEYCENKIKKAAINNDMIDRASYILLYELMIMLIQQNGNVVGVDIAALLLRNKDAYPYNKNHREPMRRESTISQRSAGSGEDGNVRDTSTPLDKEDNLKQRKTINQMTDEFRNTLLYGLVQEALEYAMDEGLWGHALFLASKLDKRTHASVMTRFANSLPSNDPLQTLYQLHSGRVPASVTCVADASWDDWRPHLAMIISNTSQNPEVNHRSITILGDTLAARGDITAAHFCYILAQSDFGPYGTNGVKLVLIGSNHNKPYSEFINNDAIMLTEIYEYARNLSEPGFTIVDLQNFKFHLALKMIDYGLIEKALLYIEQIAVNIANEPIKYKKSFINEIYNLGNRIKFHDPICKDSVEDVENLVWLNKLEEIVNKYQSGEIVQETGYVTQATTELHGTNQNHYDAHQQHWNQQQIQTDYNEATNSMMEIPVADQQQQQHSDWQAPHSNIQEPYSLTEHTDQYSGTNLDSSHYPQQQDYWNQQQNYNQQEYAAHDWQQSPQYSSDQTEVDNNQQQQQQQPQGNWGYEQQPQISLGPSASKQYDPLEELDALDAPKQVAKVSSADSKKPTEKSSDKKNSNTGSSWFGGLFSKLAPKPKNQMILPDDNNPSIVWDSVAGKWMNKEDGEDSVSGGIVAPPPKASDLGFKQLPPERNLPQQQQQHLIPPNSQNDESMAVNSSKLITGSNVYKLQKGRSMRANYIDVMNPNGGKSSGLSSNLPTPANSPMAPIASSSPQVFVPAPVNDPNAPMDFLSSSAIPTQQTAENPPQELSRWSSTSSLSREVQSYTMRDPRLLQRDKGPMMFNPMDLKDRSQKSAHRNRYPPR
ncbi:uncharacterized protein LOC127280206 isoform X3 [Leptopilina boulardi]|uniref:uncharacterized protein LOC127280206 isoform X3 n=1 Tax=Leptopilina boulardi TaxID=63433 RepID=UPI0021F5DC2D|nr:uncharacterized protein LOC127280206 isoform X3 [Leptopilina boulardi]